MNRVQGRTRFYSKKLSQPLGTGIRTQDRLRIRLGATDGPIGAAVLCLQHESPSVHRAILRMTLQKCDALVERCSAKKIVVPHKRSVRCGKMVAHLLQKCARATAWIVPVGNVESAIEGGNSALIALRIGRTARVADENPVLVVGPGIVVQ